MPLKHATGNDITQVSYPDPPLRNRRDFPILRQSYPSPGKRPFRRDPKMPVKAAAKATTEAAEAAESAVAKVTADAQKAFADATKRIEAAVQEGLTQLRAQSRVYADRAGEGL